VRKTEQQRERTERMVEKMGWRVRKMVRMEGG
jgi:hypothetical protein